MVRCDKRNLTVISCGSIDHINDPEEQELNQEDELTVTTKTIGNFSVVKQLARNSSEVLFKLHFPVLKKMRQNL